MACQIATIAILTMPATKSIMPVMVTMGPRSRITPAAVTTTPRAVMVKDMKRASFMMARVPVVSYKQKSRMSFIILSLEAC